MSLSMRTASTAQRSTGQRNHPCTKQQTKYSVLRMCRSEYVSKADQSTYTKKYVRTCMRHLDCFPGAWSSWNLQVRIYIVIPIHSSLVSERSGRAEPAARRSALYYYKPVPDTLLCAKQMFRLVYQRIQESVAVYSLMIASGLACRIWYRFEITIEYRLRYIESTTATTTSDP